MIGVIPTGFATEKPVLVVGVNTLGTSIAAPGWFDLYARRIAEPDVMTLDLEMPRMDGAAFLKKLLPF